MLVCLCCCLVWHFFSITLICPSWDDELFDDSLNFFYEFTWKPNSRLRDMLGVVYNWRQPLRGLRKSLIKVGENSRGRGFLQKLTSIFVLFVRRSSEHLDITLVDVHLNSLNWFHFLILEGGLLVILIDCMIFPSPFLDVTRMSMLTVSFLAQLDSGILCR